LPDIRVGHDLENESGEGLAIGRAASEGFLRIVDRYTLDRWNIERRRQIIDHRIEHGLDTFVLERRATDYREDLEGDGRSAQTGADFVVRDRLAFHELFE